MEVIKVITIWHHMAMGNDLGMKKDMGYLV
jgi:hypothetical protein